jgi:hypothetical protein
VSKTLLSTAFVICKLSGPEMTEELLSRQSVRLFDLTGNPMKGWLLVSTDGTKNQKDFDECVKTAIEANKKATTAKKKK